MVEAFGGIHAGEEADFHDAPRVGLGVASQSSKEMPSGTMRVFLAGCRGTRS